MVDSELQARLRARYNPDGSDLRRAQLEMLEMLSFLDRICAEHNLSYWLSSGTLIGAMRHGGFLPWDDDVDVAMTRQDAEKLRKIMGKKVYDGYIIMHSTLTDPDYVRSGWLTLRSLKSGYILDESKHIRQKYQGLQVDIFEVEQGLPYHAKTPVNMLNKYLIEGYLSKKKNGRFRRMVARLAHRFADYVVIPVSRLFRTRNTDYNYALGVPFRMNQPADNIFPVRRVYFEGRQFNVPNKAEDYLTRVFGDWQHVPEPGEVETHDVKFHFGDPPK